LLDFASQITLISCEKTDQVEIKAVQCETQHTRILKKAQQDTKSAGSALRETEIPFHRGRTISAMVAPTRYHPARAAWAHQCLAVVAPG
jgi:hypothetical protein